MERHTSLELRNLIIEHYKIGKSQREIAQIVNKARTTEIWIVKQTKIHPRLTAPKLRDMVEQQFNIGCNAETIRRVLRKDGLDVN